MTENQLNHDNKPGNSPDNDRDINLQFTLTRNDLFWYNIYFIRLLVLAAIACFLGAIGVFIYSLQIPTGDYKTTLIWIIMALSAGFSISGGTIAAIVLQVFVLKNESVNQAMTMRSYIINSAGIAVFNKSRKIVRTWNDIRRVIKTHHGYYIKTGDRIAIVLPRHVFKNDEQIEYFEQLIQLAKTG